MERIPAPPTAARPIPQSPSSLTVTLPLAILVSGGAGGQRVWRLRSVRLYSDPQVGRFRVYGALEAAGDPLEDRRPSLELVGEGPDLVAAGAALLAQLLPPSAELEAFGWRHEPDDVADQDAIAGELGARSRMELELERDQERGR